MIHPLPRQRRRARILARLASVGTMALLLSGCALTPSLENYSATAPAQLRYADYAPATASGPFDSFAAELTERTGGRVEVEPYWGGSLLSSKDLPSGLRAGIADIGIFTATQHPSEYPVTNWLAKTASLAEPEFPRGILQSYAGFAEFAYTSPAVIEQFEALGLKVLVPLHTVLNYDIICTSPITTLEEARGMRVRSGGPLWDGEMRAAGMIPVTVAIDETYEGLQRGIIDCAIANPRTAMTYGFWDIAKHYTSIPFSGINSQYVVMNQTSWNALSEEDQQILWDASFTWWSENLVQDAIRKYQEMFEIGPSEQGITFLDADPELTRSVTDYQAGVLGTLAESAPPAVEDPQGEIDYYAERMDYWLDVVDGLDLGEDPNNPDLTAYFERVKTEIWDEQKP
ncbi:C4-dicarboxylate TRAP transporter substrate-binding protein [Microbacterium aerolatum]|uniref:C4-dicarboxylate TRAP transporter substrate-binding protein n=1 Tax=Microbacterium aerolatum TaxID=153731 RepID=UPI002000C2EE|nr:C4-dicarboxylate TRAP transporter substrate-binding protein [Microbacterium aerolatum]MCK3769370.1 C4-dicarboxylate TRAP transporter substrate-binding protein [Microbacterium aerolatum]